MNDSPWAMGRTVAIKNGERLSIKQPRHRTKGAKSGKGYRESGTPDGWAADTREQALIGGNRLNSRQRRELARKLDRTAKRDARVVSGIATKVAPALKTEGPGYNPLSTIATDHSRILHDGMGLGTKRHREYHVKTAAPMGGCDCTVGRD